MRSALRSGVFGVLALQLALLIGCAAPPSPGNRVTALDLPQRWEEGPPSDNATAVASVESSAAWWLPLRDPALNQLLSQARFSSVEQALARVDEAQALLGQRKAGAQPQVSGGFHVQRGLEQNGVAQLVSRAGPSLQLGWELDLWGRQAHQQRSAELQSKQREAESRLALLVAQSHVAELVQQERACRRQSALLADEESSWTRTVTLQRDRLRVGALSDQGMARIEEQAAAQSAQRAQSQGQCRSLRQALRALTGLSPDALDAALVLEPPTWGRPPSLKPEQPASLLLQHPQLSAAAAAADAAYQELAATRAANLPSLNLSALLSHQWLRIMGHGSELNPWSLGLSLAGPLFDGGAANARSDAAQARLRGALASLDQTLRQTVRDIETAVALQEASTQQWRSAQLRAEAAARVWRAAQSTSDIGRLNAIDLEDAARQRYAAEQALEVAQRDLTVAWVGLIKATGQAPLQLDSSSQ